MTAIPVWLIVHNSGTSGIRNLYVRVTITSSSKAVEIGEWHRLKPQWMTSWDLSYSEPYTSLNDSLFDDDRLTTTDSDWAFSVEWDALQPQRVRHVKPCLYVSAAENCRVEFTTKMFADSFPEPIQLMAELDLSVRPRQVKLAELLPGWEQLRKEEVGIATLWRHLARRPD